MTDNELIAKAAAMIAEFAAHDGPVDAWHVAKTMLGMFEQAQKPEETKSAPTEEPAIGYVTEGGWYVTEEGLHVGVGGDLYVKRGEGLWRAIVEADRRMESAPQPHPEIDETLTAETFWDGIQKGISHPGAGEVIEALSAVVRLGQRPSAKPEKSDKSEGSEPTEEQVHDALEALREADVRAWKAMSILGIRAVLRAAGSGAQKSGERDV